MGKRGLAAVLTAFVLCFYAAIIMYVFFAVLHIHVLTNFISAFVFELVGFVLLAYFILSSIVTKLFKTGYLVSLILITFIYAVLVNVLNLVGVTMIPHTFFVLLNMFVLFLYCVISIPMYIMGRK